MAHPVQPYGRRVSTVAKEILVFPCGLDSIQSIVLTASGVDELPSATVGYEGKLGLLAGTILTEVSGDDQNRYEEFTGTGTVAGILTDNVYFPDASHDVPAAMFFHNCVFNLNKIKNYDDYESDVVADLKTCLFVDKTTPEEELEA